MKTSDTTKKYDKAHLINLQKYQKAVQSILDKMCEEAAALGISTGFENGSGQNFSWDNFPKARKKFTDLMWRIRKELEASIGDGIETEWKLSNTKNEQLVNELVGRIGLTAKQIEDLEPRRMEGVHAFQSRKVRGLGLSDRVWNITSLVEAQIAEAIEQNLSKGTPAQKLSQAVRQNLKEPDMMYRRYWHKVKLKNGTEKKVRVWHKKVVDSEGNVKFVESPLEAVGTGVYRSAYKNAMRMARTETNMAYHKADSNYFSQSNIILGIEVKLSNNHTTKYGEGEKTKPLVDICDELEGRYPRWFDFTGWHPQCRCVAMPITPDKAEMRKYLKMIANGEDVSKFKFTGEITKLPDNFRNWAINNEDRLVKMQRKGNLPYFIRENLSPNFRFGYGIDIDDAMKWSPYNFDYNEDYDMLMQTEVESFSGEQKTPQQIMQDKEAMIKAMLDNDLAQYSDAIKANIEEIAKLIGQKRGLSMSWEDANTSKENPHYHDKVTRYERDEKGGYIWVKKGRGLAAKETKEYKEHEQWTVNCQTCTLIHELRRRGLNVEACGNKNNSVWKVYDKHGIAHRGQKWMFEDGSYAPYYYAKKWAADNGKNMTTAKHAGEFLKATMKSVGRYEIGITWNARSAHVFSAEKLQDGTLRFFDPQSGESWDFDGIVSGYLSLPGKKYIGELRIIRTDNKLINPKLAETFIPIGELPIDVSNRPDNRELYKTQGEARHAARTPEQIEKIKAFYREWMGRYYKKKADQRHAERTKEREKEILDFWAKKKQEGWERRRKDRWEEAAKKRHEERTQEQIDDIKKRAKIRDERYKSIDELVENTIKEAENTPWFDETTAHGLKDSKWRTRLFDLEKEANEVKKKIADAKNEFAEVEKYIPSLNTWASQFTKEELVGVKDHVIKKLKEWEDKYNTDSWVKSKYASLDDYLEYKLDYEITYTATKGQKYNTWKVAEAAFTNEKAKIIVGKDIKEVETNIFSMKSMPKYDELNNLVLSAKDKLNNGKPSEALNDTNKAKELYGVLYSLADIQGYKTGSGKIKKLIADAEIFVNSGEYDKAKKAIADANAIKAKNEASNASHAASAAKKAALKAAEEKEKLIAAQLAFEDIKNGGNASKKGISTIEKYLSNGETSKLYKALKDKYGIDVYDEDGKYRQLAKSSATSSGKLGGTVDNGKYLILASRLVANRMNDALSGKITLTKEQESAYKLVQVAIGKKDFSTARKLLESVGDDLYDAYGQARKDAALWFKKSSDAHDHYFDYMVKLHKELTRDEIYALWEYTEGSDYLTCTLRGVDGYCYDTKYQRHNLDDIKRAVEHATTGLDKAVIEEDIWIKRDEVSGITGSTFGIDMAECISDYKKRAKLSREIEYYSGISQDTTRTQQERSDALDELNKRQKQLGKLKDIVGTEGVDESFGSCGDCKDTWFGSKDVCINVYCPAGTRGAYVEPISHFGYNVNGTSGMNGSKGKDWDGSSKTKVTHENEILLQRGTKYRITKVEWSENYRKLFIDVEIVEQNPRKVKEYRCDRRGRMSSEGWYAVFE